MFSSFKKNCRPFAESIVFPGGFYRRNEHVNSNKINSVSSLSNANFLISKHSNNNVTAWGEKSSGAWLRSVKSGN